MGEVEEMKNDSPLLEDVKRAIVDFCNREYDEENRYEDFDKLYPDYKHIGIAYTDTPDERHGIQYELDLEEMTWSQYVNDVKISSGDFDYEDRGEDSKLKNMKDTILLSSFEDLVSVDEEDLKNTLGLEIDDEGNFYDPLSKDLDNDGIEDRYDNDFRDSDYFESTYDVDSLHKEDKEMKEEKASVLAQIKKYQQEDKRESKESSKEQECVR